MDNYVGPYRILRLINRGGQGSVYLGYDKRLHRRVAIKIYSLPDKRSRRKLLLREAQLVASIQSPKVVQVHDVIESSGHLALVMEYVPGCSLEEFLQAVQPSLPSVLTIITDIAGAMALARQQRIVHGDLKASNVLIGTNGRAKLTDFGISRKVDEGVAGRWAAGSLSALSPEQYLGRPLEFRSDLFALGSLIYRMLSGEQPFYRDGHLDVERLLRGEPQPLEEVVSRAVELPPDLVSLVDALLQKDPQKRPRTMRRVRQVTRAAVRDQMMSTSNSLLREANPLFRPESPEDIPPPVPAGLGQAGRSRMPPPEGRMARVVYWLRSLRWPARTALALGVCTVLAVPVGVALHGGVTAVQFKSPEITMRQQVRIPGEVSRDWLLQEVKGALREQLGELYVLGPVGAPRARAMYSPGTEPDLPQVPEQVFGMGLRCVENICVFAISREQDGKHFNKQGVMFAEMSLQQWRDIVRETTLALYP